ncbi:AraC family transcriptional regulator [Streptomyces sp. B6B3]|uniref:AraC family transcriptional regulator n=1 Tax=Streptomyces sp. B6B3 TaxID=3153570 RepID=UPI00325E484B
MGRSVEVGGRRDVGPGEGRGAPASEHRVVSLGPVQVAAIQLTNQRELCTQGLETPRGTYQFVLPTRGSMHTRWNGRQSTVGQGDLGIHDQTRLESFAFGAPAEGGPVRVAAVVVPKRRLALPEGWTDRVLGQQLPGEEGVGALLSGFVERLADEMAAGTGGYRPADGPRLGAALLELVQAAIAHLLDDDATLVHASHHRSLLLRVQGFMGLHLHDPELTPRTAAAAHHISVSHLHQLFRDYGGGVTAAAWIRRQRLEHARRDLADPLLRATPVHRIATRWGFSHAAVFSRVFRSAYGVSPADYRDAAVLGPSVELRRS